MNALPPKAKRIPQNSPNKQRNARSFSSEKRVELTLEDNKGKLVYRLKTAVPYTPQNNPSSLPSFQGSSFHQKGEIEKDKELSEAVDQFFQDVSSTSFKRIIYENKFNNRISKSVQKSRQAKSTFSQSTELTKEQALSKLNYMQETFYKPKEVFPDLKDLMAQLSPHKSATKLESSLKQGLWQKTLLSSHKKHQDSQSSIQLVSALSFGSPANKFELSLKDQVVKESDGELCSTENSKKGSPRIRFSKEIKITNVNGKPPRIRDKQIEKQQSIINISDRLDKVKKHLQLTEKQLQKRQSSILLQTLITSQALVSNQNNEVKVQNQQNIEQDQKVIEELKTQIQKLHSQQEKLEKEEFEMKKTMSDEKPRASKQVQKTTLQALIKKKQDQKKLDIKQLEIKETGPLTFGNRQETNQESKEGNKLLKHLESTRQKLLQRYHNHQKSPQTTMEVLILEEQRQNENFAQLIVDRYRKKISQEKSNLQKQSMFLRQNTDQEEVWKEIQKDDYEESKHEQISILFDEAAGNDDLLFAQEDSINHNSNPSKNNSIVIANQKSSFLQQQQSFMNLRTLNNLYSQQETNQFVIKDYQIDFKNEIEAQFQFQKRQEFLSLIKNSDGLYHILQGIYNYGGLKKLVIEKNELLRLSAEQLSLILSINKPKNLESLAIIDCKTSPIPVEIFLKQLQNRCHLKKLKLIKTNMNQQSLEILGDVINNQILLQELDLSWNDFPQKGCHLSGNLISKTLKDELLIKLKIIQRKQGIDDLTIDEASQEYSDMDQIIAQEFNDDFQDYKSKVQQEEMQNRIIQNLRRQSVLVPTFSNFQSLNQSNLNKTLKNDGKDNISFDNSHSKGKYFTLPKDNLIFQRVLGHCEMKDKYKWQLSNHCNVCEKWQYVLIIFSKKIEIEDIFTFQNQIAKTTLKRHTFYKQLINQNIGREMILNFQTNAYIEGNPQFVENYVQQMIPLEEFLLKLEENYESHYNFGERLLPSEDHDMQHIKKKKQYLRKYQDKYLIERRKILDFLGGMYKRKKSLDDISTFLQVLETRQKKSEDDYQFLSQKNVDFEFNEKLLHKLQKLTKDFHPLIITNKCVEDGATVDLEKLNQNNIDFSKFKIDEEIFCFASLVPPGIHNFSIKVKKRFTPTGSFDMTKSIANFYNLRVQVHKRKQDLHVFYKKKKKSRHNRIFAKDRSSFKNWRHDTKEVIDAFFAADIKKMKYNRMTDIPDKFCTISKIDTAFIATNVEIEKNEENPDRDLTRAEFFEIILRLGNEKYKKSGQCEKFASAFRKVLKDNIFTYPLLMKYQDWREKFLWTLEIDDIFKVNSVAIRRLFAWVHTSFKKTWTLNDAMDFIIKEGQELNISEGHIKYAYVFSKMTIINEDEDHYKYNQMRYVEFLEFLGRIAWLVKVPDFKVKEIIQGLKEGQELGLPERLEYVLDVLFKCINCIRKPRENLKDQYDTESDYD